MRQLAHAKVVDDQQLCAADLLQEVLAGSVERRVGELLDESVCLAVEHVVAVVDCRQADRLREVALAGARWAEEEAVLLFGDEAARRQLEDQLLVHSRVEGEVEVVERASAIAEASVLDAALDQTVGAAMQFVLHEVGEEVMRTEALRLRLHDPRRQSRCHAGQAELAKGAIEFGRVHGLGSRSCDAPRRGSG